MPETFFLGTCHRPRKLVLSIQAQKTKGMKPSDRVFIISSLTSITCFYLNFRYLFFLLAYTYDKHPVTSAM
jgi:hypothetical protein